MGQFPSSPNNRLLYFLPSCLLSPPRCTSASSTTAIHHPPSTPHLPLPNPHPHHHGEARMLPLLFFPGGFGWGDIWRHLDVSFGSSSWGPANSLSSDRCLNLSQCLSPGEPPPLPPRPHFTFLHTYGDRPRSSDDVHVCFIYELQASAECQRWNGRR